jgi:outer membrane murein-binding lipoprotein Lpp
MKFFYIILAFLLFSGCESDIFNEKKVQELQKHIAELKAQQDAQVEKTKLEKASKEELAKLQIEKELTKIEKVNELEKYKLDAELKKEQLKVQKQKDHEALQKESELKKIELENELKKERIAKERARELELIRQETALVEAQNSLELRKYLFGVLALLMVIISFFIYYYFKKRREDKLIAYNDNLKKYFLQKENEARIQIANKMLDTISECNLSREDQNRLIEVLGGNGSSSVTDDTTIEFIEEKKL